jgi:hypothetical protein
VLRMLFRNRIQVHLLKFNGGGHPAHPLYLPGTLTPAVFPPPSRASARARDPRG